MARPPRPRQYPPTGHVIIALVASIGLWAYMIFLPLAFLRHIAGGLAPFDLRPFGYTVEEARTFLHAISQVGRDYYLDVQLPLDTAAPALYALSRGLLLFWLTQPGRIVDSPLPPLVRAVIVALPVFVAGFDYLENASIVAMLHAGPQVDADTVAQASFWTQAKWLAALASEMTCVALLLLALARWWHRRSATR